MEILEELIVSVHHLADINFSGWATSWIYLCAEPNEGIVLQLGKFIEKKEAKYLAMCWEKSVSGKQILIVFMVFKSSHSENSLKTRYGLSGGILLAKTQRRITLSLIVQWMKGNYYFEGKMKPANSTFQEMRQRDYMMRGRERDEQFIESIWG